MSTADEMAALLADLQTERRTGCLTITSADGLVCRIYLLMGKAFHAEGPVGEGQSAITDPQSWPNVNLSFDEKAKLPDKQTIAAPQLEHASGVGSEPSNPTDRFPILSDDRRVSAAQIAYVGAGCLFAVVMVFGLGAAVVEGALHARLDAVIGTSIALLFVTGLVWVVLYLRYRRVFGAEAVRVPNGLERAHIPRVIDAPSGVIGGEPELVVSLPARYLAGRLGKCHIEFYPAGLQIWKGPKHPEPRWQFEYADLLQAESVVLSASGGRNSREQYCLRLIAARPRMAFLFGNTFTNRDTQLMLGELGRRGVRTFTET